MTKASCVDLPLSIVRRPHRRVFLLVATVHERSPRTTLLNPPSSTARPFTHVQGSSAEDKRLHSAEATELSLVRSTHSSLLQRML